MGAPTKRQQAVKTLDDRFQAWANGIHQALKKDLEATENRIREAIGKAKELPDTWADRILRKAADSHHSYAIIGLYTLFAFIAGAAFAAWIGQG